MTTPAPAPRSPAAATDATGYLLLEDGTRLDGLAVAADRAATGEVVFTTGMSGYQESVTDPSFAGQIVVFTTAHVGNYGVRASAMESDRVHARAVVMRDAVDRTDAPAAEQGWLTWLAEQGVPGLHDLDTRFLVRHLRDKGSMRGGVFPAGTPEDEARAAVEAEPPMAGQDLASTVTPDTAHVVGADRNPGGPLIAAIDTGIKRSIVDELVARGARVRLHPLSDGPEALLGEGAEGGPADAVFLANGPGDPGAVEHVVETVRGVLGRTPLFGICMGHQLTCRALGLETFKLPFGHRGANHPVKDLSTGKIEITSQNHGFAVQTPDGTGRIPGDEPVRWETPAGTAELSHLNLYDRTVEGLVVPGANAATVQYHPEAAPGPNDASYLFDRFLARITDPDPTRRSVADVTRQTEHDPTRPGSAPAPRAATDAATGTGATDTTDDGGR